METTKAKQKRTKKTSAKPTDTERLLLKLEERIKRLEERLSKPENYIRGIDRAPRGGGRRRGIVGRPVTQRDIDEGRYKRDMANLENLKKENEELRQRMGLTMPQQVAQQPQQVALQQLSQQQLAQQQALPYTVSNEILALQANQRQIDRDTKALFERQQQLEDVKKKELDELQKTKGKTQEAIKAWYDRALFQIGKGLNPSLGSLESEQQRMKDFTIIEGESEITPFRPPPELLLEYLEKSKQHTPQVLFNNALKNQETMSSRSSITSTDSMPPFEEFQQELRQNVGVTPTQPTRIQSIMNRLRPNLSMSSNVSEVSIPPSRPVGRPTNIQEMQRLASAPGQTQIESFFRQ